MIYKIKSILEKLMWRFYGDLLAPYLFDKRYSRFDKIKIQSIMITANDLLNSNKSMGRFGDGELSWMIGKKSGVGTFQKSSNRMAKRLREVFTNDDPEFMVTLPDSMYEIQNKNLTTSSKRFWKYFFVKNAKHISSFLNKETTYYNTSVTRPYIDYNENKLAKNTFTQLKKIWDGKKILIVEGSQSRLGYNDDLFINCSDIKRIECPNVDAFEIYDDILEKTLEFLKNNNEYLTLVSLGPTATILSYDLFKNGFRSLDVGHIDVEYEWYLIGAKEKISLADKYVNEAVDGNKEPDKADDYSHDNEIFYKF